MAAAAPAENFFSRDNPLFATYAFYTTVLVFKVLLMAVLTARQRMSKKIFSNPEDATLRGGKIKFDDPDVERVRRAHLNDLENIPAFLFVSFLYILTSPCEMLTLNLFRAYTAARVLHTVVYAVVPLPQPSRAIAFFVGIVVTGYMGVQVLIYFL